MKKILLICFVVLSISGFGQSLKKKYLGVYKGEIAGYALDLGSDVVDVKPAVIIIDIESAAMTQTIGNVVQKGTWTMEDSGDDRILISFHPENSLVEERIVLYKKGKRMIREGIYPQPEALLLKQ